MRKIQFVLYSISLLILASCLGKKNQSEIPGTENNSYDPRYATEMSRTSKDSTTIRNLTIQYLDLLKGGQYDEALKMLYAYNEEDCTVQPIDKGHCKMLMSSYESFPVLDFKIDTLLMYSETDTEVRYSYQFFEKPADSPLPNTISGSVCPHRVNGEWYLTIPFAKNENVPNVN